jgi:putative two-component system hydrogenase maturation factor HypX/HoxX
VRILLLCSAFNGLSQRVWTELRRDGHHVVVQTADSDDVVRDAVARTRPDLVLCPFLKERVPADVWRRQPTVVLHPGPVGDRGPSSLDWAISEGAGTWGVTALQAVEEMDAGPIWATRTFALPPAPARKSSLYYGPVADAAMECIEEVLAKATDPHFRPVPIDDMPTEVPGTGLRPLMRQPERAFDWSEPTEHILRRIRAADGAPGVRTELAGFDVFTYDAHPGLGRGRPGTLLSRRQGAVLVATGDGSVWIGHLRAAAAKEGIKLPATRLLGARLRDVPNAPLPPGTEPETPSAYR